MSIEIYTDGGSRGNPGPAAIGGIVNIGIERVYEFSETIGVGTNNEAEYKAIQHVLEWLDSHPQEATLPVICYLDSKLVVEQLSKNWKIKEPRMKLLAENCWKTLISIPNSVSFRHIPREKNTDSDALVNKALDAQVE